MGTKVGKCVVHRINDDLIGGYLLLQNGNYWSFVASEKEGDYGNYHSGYGIEGCTIDKDERKDGEFWVTVGSPKERSEGGCVKVLKATRCRKKNDEMVFDDEPTFTGSLYASGIKGLLQGFLYQEEEDDVAEEDEEPPKKKSTTNKSKTRSSSKKSNNNSFAW